MKRLTLILVACLLPLFSGCGHRETAQAAVHLGVTADALLAAKTIEQARAIAAWMKQVLGGIAKREAAGLSDPVVPLITVEQVLAATDPALTPEQRQGPAATVNKVISADLQQLGQAAASDAAVAGGINWAIGLLAATTAGGVALGVLAKVRTAFQTVQSVAAVAFDGMHQAQTALRTVAPEAADAIDVASLNLQSHLPPAVKAMGDALVAKVKTKPRPIIPNNQAA